MPNKLTDEQLVAILEQEESDAYGLLSSDLTEQRAAAMDRYLGRPYGDEVAGRSSVISNDTQEVIEWVLPELLKVFIAGDSVVKFEPNGPEDEQQAEQETDYINHVVLQKNNGFVVFNTWFKDALLQKTGYVKAFRDKRTDVMSEDYVGLSDEELALMQKDVEEQEIEIVAHSARPDPIALAARNEALQGMGQQLQAMQAQMQQLAQTQDPGQQQQAQQQMGQLQQQMAPLAQQFQQAQQAPLPQVHDVKVRRKSATEYTCIEPIPPEEMLVSVKTREVGLQRSPFVQHRPRKTISELRQMGYEIPDDIADDTLDSTSSETNARNQFGENLLNEDNAVGDESTREVTFKESWIRLDVDGDGVAELRRICSVGSTILANDYTELVPIAAITPLLMPHKHIGLSYADLTADVAQIKTTLLRQALDNLYLQNNGRHAVDKNTVNLEDMLISRPGGIVRTDGPPGQSVMPLTHPGVASGAFEGLNYMDYVRENRTGVSKQNQSLDPKSIDKTATEASIVESAEKQRIEMVARCFAETGVKELFWIVHQLSLKYSTKAEKVKLRNKWVEVNPREWQHRYDMTISVGLGHGNKDQTAAHLQMILGAQQQAMQIGVTNPQKIYNALSKLAINAGFRDPDQFFSDPGPNPPPPQKPPQVQAAEIQAQSKEHIAQMQMGADQQHQAMQAQGEQQKTQADAQTKIIIAHLDAQLKRELEQFKAIINAQLEQQKQSMQAYIQMHNTAREQMMGHNGVQ